MRLPVAASSLLILMPAILAAQDSRSSIPQASRAPTDLARAFDRYTNHVRTRWDDSLFFVESDGIPDHQMMVGITAWQQQVPLPQVYTGQNAWQFPLRPAVAANPTSARTHFFRGAIAIAVNGVPIFNPIKNDGTTDTFLAGELDLFGGHSGRADDYHYHLAPAFLNAEDPAKPVAYALDGYPIFGFKEPDGSPTRALDPFNGHDDPKLGYHYHATKSYPYLNGGFHGEVTEREGQVDPQPHAHPIRPATTPLRGARITDFRTLASGKSFELTYEQAGKTGSVHYTIVGDGTHRFTFTNTDGTTHEETYAAGPVRAATPAPASRPTDRPKPPRGGPDPADPNRKPWIVDHVAEMDQNHDGVLTRAEMTTEIRTTFTGYDRDADGKVTAAERDTRDGVRSAMGGFVRAHWAEVDADHDGSVTADELERSGLSMFDKADRDGNASLSAAELTQQAPAPPQDAGPASRPARGGGQRRGEGRGAESRRTTRARPPDGFRLDVPNRPFDLILTRPTKTSITASLYTAEDLEGFIEFGPEGIRERKKSPVRTFSAGKPAEILMDGLNADTACTYRFFHRAAGTNATDFEGSEPKTFHTQRARGQSFEFTVQADSHLDPGTDLAVYTRTLQNVVMDHPDFHVDLGDTFMTDKRRGNFRTALLQYQAQRWYFGIVGVASPVFLTVGNHDGEIGWRDQGDANDMPHWSNAQRKLYFPGPEPGGIYTGNTTPDAVNGLLQNYYAFEWGDALFVVLDPFWATRDHRGKADDRWSWTLGEAQYRWLTKTVTESRAKFKFVFIHHLVGGADAEARGGSEASVFGEWGGRDADGTLAFPQRRRGWDAPIHDLLRRAGVQVVFHGHDHFFAEQDRDGIVYQLVPQPGHLGNDAEKMAAEYGYASGTILPPPGYMRVRVAPEASVVEFVRSSVRDARSNGRVVHSYTLTAPK